MTSPPTMPRPKRYRSTQKTISLSLLHLQKSLNDLRRTINEPGNGSQANNSVVRQGLYGLHLSITVLLTAVGIDRTPFIRSGLRTDLHVWTGNPAGDGIHERDEIENVGRLLEMLKHVLNVGIPAKRVKTGKDEGDSGTLPVKTASNSKTAGLMEHEEVNNQQIMNSGEIAALAPDVEANISGQSVADNETTNAVVGTVHEYAPMDVDNDAIPVQIEERAICGDKESSTDGDNGELPVISSDIHPRAVDEFAPAMDSDQVDSLFGFSEMAPVMIDLETHELAILPGFDHPPVDDSLTQFYGGEPTYQQEQEGKEVACVIEEPDAVEIEVVPDQIPIPDNDNAIHDGIGPMEIIDEMIGEIGELVDENNSLCGDDESQLLANGCLVQKEEGKDLHGNDNEFEEDSEKTVSCCVAGSLIEGQEGIHRPIFTDVREEDKIWVIDGEICSPPRLLKSEEE